MSNSTSAFSLRSTGSLEPSLVTLPSSSSCSSIYSEDDVPDLQLPPKLCLVSAPAQASDSYFSCSESNDQSSDESKSENEDRFDLVFDSEPKPILMPELFKYSMTAELTRPPPSPLLSPLSRPTISSTSSSTSSSSTTSSRSPLNSAIHQTTYTLSSLNLIGSGFQNIQSSYFHASTIPILFPGTTSLLKSLSSLYHVLELVLSRLQHRSARFPWTKRERSLEQLVTQTNELMKRFARSLEDAFSLLKRWDGRCPEGSHNIPDRSESKRVKDEKKRLMISTDGQVAALGLRIEAFESEIKREYLSSFERGVCLLRGWFCLRG